MQAIGTNFHPVRKLPAVLIFGLTAISIAFLPHQPLVPAVTGTKLAGKDPSKLTNKTRISVGIIPPEGKYPSLARIEQFNHIEGWRPLCAGSILNRHWILSNAGCFSEYPKYVKNVSKLRVVVGDSVRNDSISEPFEQIFGIERFIMHQNFDPIRYSSGRLLACDVAVAKVVPAIKFSNRVSPVNLAACDVPESEQLGTGWIAVWGGEADGSGAIGYNLTDRLYEVHNLIMTVEECNKWLAATHLKYRVTDLLICTRQDKEMGWFWLDNGAPLFLIHNESYMVQVGIASQRPIYSAPCGYTGQMTMYTRVSKYLGWIHRRISGCGSHPFYTNNEVFSESSESGERQSNHPN